MSSILSLMHKSRVPFAIHCPLTQLYIIYHSELALSNPFLDLVYSYLIYTTTFLRALTTLLCSKYCYLVWLSKIMSATLAISNMQ